MLYSVKTVQSFKTLKLHL